MAEYIEREKVLEMLLSADDGNIGSENWRAAIDTATTGLYNMPAADVQDVRHGKWVFGEFDGIGYPVWCSECEDKTNKIADPVAWITYSEHKYCGNCGAKMDGKDV